ncbi:MAG: acetyl-CoA carboxylase carboxyltransferase subunit alpha [Planctomycetota bacterium]|nr:acetyl-CoA carboxylase carboxyltransferase subunit alpha [Planctomycetota bacterium]
MATFYQLDFEKPVVELERQIEALEAAQPIARGADNGVGPGPASEGDQSSEADQGERQTKQRAELHAELRAELSRTMERVYSKIGPWETVRIARHPQRPQTRDYIQAMTRDFAELHGDRRFGDDPAIVTGFCRIGPHKCLLVGHQKGKETAEKIACHFGCAHPEGYRKALAKMEMAEKFNLPIVTLVDTPGAYPGLGAEQRGQAEAIAVNMREMSRLRTPIVSVVIGEGGSGGALGIAVADRVAMLQYAWYSVISPEGCAAILWKEANEQTNAAAARALKLTASDNLSLGIVDAVIPEPPGAAHRHPAQAAAALQHWIIDQLTELRGIPVDELLEKRYQRFRRLGEYQEAATAGNAVP